MEFTREEVYEAYFDARKKKRNTPPQIEFELNLYDNLEKLYNDLKNNTYKIGKSICFIVLKPKPREVFAASFRDRIVHHLVILKLMPLFEEYFIRNSFSCMKGRGILDGVTKLQEALRRHPNGYVARYDLRNFFMSISKELLANSLSNFIDERYNGPHKEDLITLVRMIVLHHPELDCIRKSPLKLWDLIQKGKSLFTVPKELGVAIGNLHSQLFAGFILTFFDLWMQDKFGDDYGRYVDDFYVVHDDPEFIKSLVPEMRDSLAKYGFTLHPDKLYIQKVSHGCKFIGSDVYLDRIYTGNRTLGNIINLMQRYNNYKIRKKDRLNFLQSFNSYFGTMIHTNSYRLRRMIVKLFRKGFWIHFEVRGPYRYIKLKSKLKDNEIFKIPYQIVGYISSNTGCTLVKSWKG